MSHVVRSDVLVTAVRRREHDSEQDGSSSRREPAGPTCKLKLNMTSYNMPRHPISSPLHSITVFSLVLNTEYSLSSVWHPTDISQLFDAYALSQQTSDTGSDRRPYRVLTPDTGDTARGEALVSRLARRCGRHSPRVHTTSIPVRNHSLAARSRCTRARSGDTIHTRRVELPSPLHPWISTSSPPMARG